ncbi:anti-sigma factor family protein [Micromonospora sp. NBC_01813]|uniref:anti-sigma factor family protein n=1 Tax=Micromonospora sp. NBC_01813 TaxID=2975988 RepID=UPI002DD97459|nr:zf-HC2 domain-containing protein [Micromonospora sp. NBC_01813]WSA07897.1 zf-HC2 domain-containing protein [Micromonospora sp. NBC_01813]
MRCDYAHDDGAYVLGALSPSERAAYEHHLSGCAGCRQAVAEIAVLPGLLGRLDPAGFEQISDPPLAGPRLSTLVGAADRARRRGRRMRRWQTAGAALAAAGLAIVVGFGVGWVGAGGTPETTPGSQLTAMQPVATEIPIHAEVGLRSVASTGTEVTMRCWWEPTNPDGNPMNFELVAYDRDGAKQQVGSWAVSPGAEIVFTGATRFEQDQLERLELVRADGAAILTYQVS